MGLIRTLQSLGNTLKERKVIREPTQRLDLQGFTVDTLASFSYAAVLKVTKWVYVARSELLDTFNHSGSTDSPLYQEVQYDELKKRHFEYNNTSL